MSRRSGLGAAGTLIAACLFGAALLFSLLAGAGVYRQVQQRTSESADRRLGLSYLMARVHAYDADGMVSAGDFHGADALCLYEESDGTRYETVLYVCDGYLRELLYEEGAELELPDGEPITEAQSLSVTERNGLLSLRYVDATGTEGLAEVYVRSGD